MSDKAASTRVDKLNDKENGDDAARTISSETSAAMSTVEKATTSSQMTNHKQSEEHLHCLLLCDTSQNSAPAQLQELFKNFKLQSLTKAEVLFQLVYIIAMESGFAEQITYETCISQLKIGYPFEIFFDIRNVLCLAQQKPAFNFDVDSSKFRMKLKSTTINRQIDADCDNIVFVLSGIVTGDFMILTLMPVRDESPMDECSSRSICLTIPRYIIGSAWKDSSKPLHRYLAAMDEFSNNLRETLFYPVQNDYLAMLGVELYPALLGLPVELYDNIFHCLSYNQLRILANVNRQLNQLVVNSKHYKREPVVQNRLSFLSPSQSRNSFGFGWDIM